MHNPDADIPKNIFKQNKKRTKKRNRIELIQYEGQQYLYVILDLDNPDIRLKSII